MFYLKVSILIHFLIQEPIIWRFSALAENFNSAKWVEKIHVVWNFPPRAEFARLFQVKVFMFKTSDYFSCVNEIKKASEN